MKLEKNQLLNLLSFFRIVCNLKTIKRSGWIHKSNITSPESVADHSYSMCMMSMILAEIINLDSGHIMKMVIIHDLAESLVGDHMPDDISSEEKQLVEDKAMKKIISKLPNSLRKIILIFGMNIMIISQSMPSLFIVWTSWKWFYKQKNMSLKGTQKNYYNLS